MPLWEGELHGSPSNTMWPRPRPTCMPSFIWFRPTVWPQYTNVADRQRSYSIGQAVLQTVAQLNQGEADILDSVFGGYPLLNTDIFRQCLCKITAVCYGRPYSNVQAIIFLPCGFFLWPPCVADADVIIFFSCFFFLFFLA